MTARKRREHRLTATPQAVAARKNLSSALREYRTKHGLSLEELADKVGCSKMQIYHLEKKNNDPSHALYLAICRVLGVEAPLT